MSNAAAEGILASLQGVRQERRLRETEPALQASVEALKAYQQQRFRNTYADLLQDARHAPAARYFLDELYGPGDFSERDAQFERVVPTLVRLFPEQIVSTVGALARLHALSESLDSAMGRALAGAPPSAGRYVAAWQATGRPADREAQVALALQIGERLDRYTRNPLLRNSLRVMRGPARAAGLSSLQGFLERGFDTFRAMRGASFFLDTIGRRERALIAALDAADPSLTPAPGGPLGQLPWSQPGECPHTGPGNHSTEPKR